MRSTPGGASLGELESSISGSVQLSDFGTCDETTGVNNQHCYEQQGTSGVFRWWTRITVGNGISINFPSGVTGWVDNAVMITKPADPANSFVLGSSARKDDDGTSTPILNQPAGSTAFTAQSGQYCTITANREYRTASWYWPVNCLNVGIGWMPDGKVEATAAPSNLFTVSTRVQVNISPTINVRIAPAGTFVNTQAVGAAGAVVSGPRFATGISGTDNYWWEVNFDAGSDGFVANVVGSASGLILANPPPTLDIIPPTADATINITGGLTGGSGQAGSLANCISQAAAGTEAVPFVTKCVLPAGTLNLSTGITYTIPIAKTIIVDFDTNDPTVNLTSGAGAITFQGTGYESNQTVTTVDTNNGHTRACFLALPAGWKKDDIVKLFSLDDLLPYTRFTTTNNHRVGELFEIDSVTSTCATFNELRATIGEYTSNIRAARLTPGQLWLVKPRITGSEAFALDGPSPLTVQRLIKPRITDRYQRFSSSEFLILSNTWRAIDYEQDCASGVSDLSFGGSDCVNAIANKHALIVGTKTKTNCTLASECTDSNDGGTPAANGVASQYGYDMYTTVRGIIGRELDVKAYTSHGGSFGIRYEDVEEHHATGTAFCITVRAKEVVIDGMLCDRPAGKGIQIGVANDGKAGDVDILNSTFTVASQSGAVDTSATVPGAAWSVTDSTCNVAMSGLISKVNSPGC